MVLLGREKGVPKVFEGGQVGFKTGWGLGELGVKLAVPWPCQPLFPASPGVRQASVGEQEWARPDLLPSGRGVRRLMMAVGRSGRT